MNTGLVRLIQSTFSKNAVLTGTFEADEIDKGNCFHIQKRITLGPLETLTLCFDFSQAIDCFIYTMPITKIPNIGTLYTDTYTSDFTGTGTVYDVALNLNQVIDRTALTPILTGVTPVGPKAHLRQYASGSPSTNQNSGGGGHTSDNSKIMNNDPLFIELYNTETTSTMVINFEFQWYELLTN